MKSFTLEELAKHHENTGSIVHKYVTEADYLALAAQVEVLRQMCMEDYEAHLKSNDRMRHEDVPDAVQQWAKEFLPSPNQCLRDIQAEAGRAGFIAGALCARHPVTPNAVEIKESADQYANRIWEGTQP